jgi:hypothetical protein
VVVRAVLRHVASQLSNLRGGKDRASASTDESWCLSDRPTVIQVQWLLWAVRSDGAVVHITNTQLETGGEDRAPDMFSLCSRCTVT